MVKHGSLTRAGKVRKQTPKVEPKERIKKILVGRAKKRKQFQKKSSILVQEGAARKRYKPNQQKQGK